MMQHPSESSPSALRPAEERLPWQPHRALPATDVRSQRGTRSAVAVSEEAGDIPICIDLGVESGTRTKGWHLEKG